MNLLTSLIELYVNKSQICSKTQFFTKNKTVSIRKSNVTFLFIVVVHFIFSLTLALGCINCAQILHETLLTSIMRWPMELFDTTPLGRIVNRFSRDVEVVDTILPLNWRVVISQAFSVIKTQHYIHKLIHT